MRSSPSVAGRSRSSMPVDSTMKNGLPPARPVIVPAWSSLTRPPPALRTSSVASPSDSGSSRRQTWLAAPVPHVGRSSSRSVRVATRTSTFPGPCRPRAATRSIRSSIWGRSVWASSNSRVTGRSLARPSMRERKPERTSWTNADSSRRGSLSPSNAWRRSTVRASGPGGHTRWTSSRRRCTATSTGSASPMPATSRTMAAAGANVALSAPRWLRPTNTVPSGSNPARNSAASLDLPIPGSPTTVNRSGRDVVITRENERRSIELVGAPHERDRPAGGPRAEAVDGEACERLGEALGLDEPLLPEGHRPFGERPRGLPRQHLARSGGGLEPRGRVDDGPRHEQLAVGAGSGGGLAGFDPDPDLERGGETELLAEAAHTLPDREPGAHRPERVVLVHLREPEDGHHRVADELLGTAAEDRKSTRL